MGEAIITRAGGGEADTVIPITPGYHTIRCTISDFEGKRVPEGVYVNCKDGTRWYNYKTNASGQVMFVCNSGSANLNISNNVNGIRFLDFNTCLYNIDAPIGLTTDLKINLNKGSTKYNINTNSTIRFVQNRLTEVAMIGGGQGGYNGTGSFWSDRDPVKYGNGGNAGWYKENKNMQFIGGTYYNCYIGQRGSIGGGSGGTTYIANTDMSAAGGGPGGTNAGAGANSNSANGKGGDGVNGLGGGGGYFITQFEGPNVGTSGGSPYGGHGCYWHYEGSTVWYMPAGSGRGPGGGGGGGQSNDNNPNGGYGANGIIIINIKY